jgi:hypothetical protein
MDLQARQETWGQTSTQKGKYFPDFVSTAMYYQVGSLVKQHSQTLSKPTGKHAMIVRWSKTLVRESDMVEWVILKQIYLINKYKLLCSFVHKMRSHHELGTMLVTKYVVVNKISVFLLLWRLEFSFISEEKCDKISGLHLKQDTPLNGDTARFLTRRTYSSDLCLSIL